MSHWRVRQHYGFGAGRIAIQPEPHRAGRASIRLGLAAIGEELTDGGPLASLRRIGGELPAILLGLLILSAFVVTLTRDHSDRSAIEVVVLQSRPAPEPLPEPPPPAPEPAPKAVPRPAPALIVEPPAARPVERLAERPKPPVDPLVKPPVDPLVKPRVGPSVLPEIARVEPPPPAPRSPSSRAEPRRPRALAEAVPTPRVAIEPVASESHRTRSALAEPPPQRSERLTFAPPPGPAPRELRPSTPAAPALDEPPPAPPPPRAFRVATAPATAGERPRAMPGLAPPAVAPAVASHALDQVPSTPVVRGDRRPIPQDESRPVPRLAAAPARVSSLPAAEVPSLPNRVKRAAADLSVGVTGDRPGLAGVPLGDLAACMSDREEDRLKQAVVAAVTTQDECVSRSGRYRFVQTRNLNAFLMWIDRAPGRGVEDRCGELRNALECLVETGRQAAR